MIHLLWTGEVNHDVQVVYDGPIVLHGDEWSTFPLAVEFPGGVFGGTLRREIQGCVGPSRELTMKLRFTVTDDTDATDATDGERG